MVTGGFRTAQSMTDAITNDGVDLIGLGRPLCLVPDAPAGLLSGNLSKFETWEHRLRLGSGILGPQSPIVIIKAINAFGSMSWFNEQILRLGAGLKHNLKMNFLMAFIRQMRREARTANLLDKRANS
jgi:hypothetical protein